MRVYVRVKVENMSKKISLFLAIVLVAILAATMVACNGVDGSQFVDKVPGSLGEPNVDTETPSTSVEGGEATLKFVWPNGMSSVFSSISTADFDIDEDVKYQVVYTKGAYTSETEAQPVTVDMVDEADRALLSQAGHHNINVTAQYKGVDVKGSFALHLRNPYVEPKKAQLTFNLNGGKANFGETISGVAKITIEAGASFSWGEFMRTFYVSKQNQAVAGFIYNNTTFNEESQYSLTIDRDTAFEVIWTTNQIEVTFDFNHPQYKNTANQLVDAPVEQGKTLIEPEAQSIEIGKKIVRPDANLFNVLDGFYFAGWYVKEGTTYTDKLWNFTTVVSNKPITLYAKWTTKYYTSTIYTMGGTLPLDTVSSRHTDGITEITLENAESLGYTIVQNNVTRSLTTNNVTKITFSELVFGRDYSNYVSQIDIDGNGHTAVMTLSDIQNKLEKGHHIIPVGVYSSEACRDGEIIDFGGQVSRNEVGYIKWALDYDESTFIDNISDYFVNLAFKDGYTIKADGSVRLDDLADKFMNEFIVPSHIKIDGILRPVSEIGQKAMMNARSLYRVDLSRATNLTTIGKNAFAGCVNMRWIVIPTSESGENIETITEIGTDAFKNTDWQNNYVEYNNGKEFIVVNKILYKYVGDGSIEDVDFSQDYYNTTNMPGVDADKLAALNTQLKNIEEIAEGCFSNAKNIKTVTLSKNVKSIATKAFVNLSKLESVQVEAGSLLNSIDGNAFEGSTMFLSGENNGTKLANNVTISGADTIVIGSVLYRVLDDVDAYEVPSYIITIGANAFAQCPSLTTLKFVGEGGYSSKNIVNIGEDAFSATKWISETREGTDCSVVDGFAVINGILAEYYSPYSNFYDAVVPDSVKIIGSKAFNSYSRYIQTIQIGMGVEEIKDYAFYGATDLRKFILSKVTVGGAGLQNIPKINPNSFASSNGELIDGIEFYFTEEVIGYFEDGLQNETTIAEADKAWFELFKLNQDSFKVETIGGVWINPAVVPQKTVITSASADVFKSETYEDGLVIQSSAGLIKYETLSLTANNVVVNNTSGTHILTFTYPGAEDVCHVSDGDAHVFKYDVIYAVAGILNADKYGTSDTIIAQEDVTRNNSLTNNYWIEGFGDNRVVTADGLPGFFTSQTSIDNSKVEFVYKDFLGVVHRLPISGLTGYAPNANSVGTVNVAVDFYGVGIFKLAIKYRGVESKWETMEQVNAISIPLNGNASTFLSNARVYLTGQDGSRRSVNLGGAFVLKAVDGVAVDRGTTLSSLPTNKLGYHTFEVEYSSNALNGAITQELVYAVVLEADTSQFVFEIVGNHAEILQYNNNRAETIVIPNEYVSGGVEYPVTVIKANVFKDFKQLKSIYVPASITRISESAFEGCTALENFYASSSIEYVKTDIDDTDFEIVSETVEQIGSVKITGLNTGLASREIVVPQTVTLTSRDTSQGYLSYVTTEASVTFSPELFSAYTGDIYLAYTDYNLAYAQLYLKNKYPVFMVETAPTAIDGVEWVEYSRDNKDLVDTNREENPETIYLFYTLDVEDASSMDRFVVDESTLEVSEKTIIRERQLVKLSVEDTDTIIVGDEYVSESVVDGVKVTTLNKTSSVADTITNVAQGTVIYLPDTIFNTTVITDTESAVVIPTVYKAGSTQLFRTAERAPRGLEYIGNNAFKGCVSLKIINFSFATKLADLGSGAFAGSGLVTLDLSATAITEINAMTFYECVSLETVTLPEAIEYIGNEAFSGCSALTTINNLQNAQTIGAGAFSRCVSLQNVVLGANLVSVGNGAFAACADTLVINCVASSKPAGWADDWYGTSQFAWNYVA